MRVAILIDGGFYLKKFKSLYPGVDARDPAEVAKRIRWLIGSHLKYINRVQGRANEWSLLYRSFYYDARPYVASAQKPVSKQGFSYAKTDEAVFREALFARLRKEPNMAVRLGEVRRDGDRSWTIKAEAQKALLAGRLAVSDLTDEDFSPALRQKGVDMRIGLDMASVSLKRQAEVIVLVTGDSDFVPAAKLARREGVRVVLDPLWQTVDDALWEHIDGLYSGVARPGVAPQSEGDAAP